jgi:hypothetical protein
MKASKFTEAQIAFVLRQAEEGTPITRVRWVPSCSCPGAPWRMGGERKTHLSPLQGIRPAIA